MAKEAHRNRLFLILAITLVIALLAIFYFKGHFETQAELSPSASSQLQQVEEANAYGLPWFILKVEEKIEQGLGKDSGIVETGESGAGGDSITLACGATMCRTFVTEKIIKRDPLNRDPLWWKKLFEDQQINRQIEQLIEDAREWIDSIDCQNGCNKVVSGDVSIFMEPVNTRENPSCSGGSASQTVSATKTSSGLFGTGNLACEYATSDAFNEVLRLIRNLMDNTCGEDCASSVSISHPIIGDFQRSGNECTVTVSVDVDINCLPGRGKTGGSAGRDYHMWVELNACVTCVPEGDIKVD